MGDWSHTKKMSVSVLLRLFKLHFTITTHVHSKHLVRNALRDWSKRFKEEGIGLKWSRSGRFDPILVQIWSKCWPESLIISVWGQVSIQLYGRKTVFDGNFPQIILKCWTGSLSQICIWLVHLTTVISVFFNIVLTTEHLQEKIIWL